MDLTFEINYKSNINTEISDEMKYVQLQVSIRYSNFYEHIMDDIANGQFWSFAIAM